MPRPRSNGGRQPSASFSYHWRGLEIDGIVERHGDAVRLSQAIGICVLPYSAEDAGERARIASFLVRAPNRTEGRFSLGPGQEVVFVVQTPVAQPINGPRLAAACVQGALAAMPHLDVFRRSLSGWVPDVNASRSSAA